MSTRASEDGVDFGFADAFGEACVVFDCGAAATDATQQAAQQAATTASVATETNANRARAGMHPFSARSPAGSKKSRGRQNKMQLTPKGLSPYLEYRCRASAITATTIIMGHPCRRTR